VQVRWIWGGRDKAQDWCKPGANLALPQDARMSATLYSLTMATACFLPLQVGSVYPAIYPPFTPDFTPYLHLPLPAAAGLLSLPPPSPHSRRIHNRFAPVFQPLARESLTGAALFAPDFHPPYKLLCT
jgi:hypothetical protein